MTFITLLLCLSLERFLHQGNFLRRFTWFDGYVSKLQPFVSRQSWLNSPYWFLLLITLPILILVAMVYSLSAWSMHGLLAFLLGALILFYCLGPMNIYGQPDLSEEDPFCRENEAIFAVIFWFSLFGPVLALAYRLVERCAKLGVNHAQLSEAAARVQAIFDWLPVRFLSLMYALVGNFTSTSEFLWDHGLAKVSRNHELLATSGRIALGLPKYEPLASEQLLEAANLVDRSVILFLFFSLIFTLGVLF